LLEHKLQQRDYELQTLQIEIEKGTSSIMSSIEDLYIASSSVSPSQHSPLANRALVSHKTQPTIEELQNELDQLHDKLDELTRENQTLKNRTQEFDTIYEENEYLYAEKSHWNEEMEHARIRELVLEQEIRTLKEREKEFLLTSDSNINTSNTTQLKLKIDWLHRTNNQLELEIVRLREQLDLTTKKYQDTKKESIHRDEHYKQLLTVAEDKQQLPQVNSKILMFYKKK
jgi:regulator of replication initiation timing